MSYSIILMSIWREIGRFVGYKFGGIYFSQIFMRESLVDIFWHEIRRSNFEWFQIGIDQTMKQVIPEMILIWRVEIYCRLPLYLIQSGFIESIAIKISKFSSKLFFVFRVFLDFGARLGPGRWFRTTDFLVEKNAWYWFQFDEMPFFVYKLTGSYIMDNYDEW